ncbi:MAG: hypothetical protein CV087_23035 [Candidatus Brocadia sp. WS118]|nr:MAG: hypothetical protein CV087_23035 [Candidatus Brocadia sp. WS118]
MKNIINLILLLALCLLNSCGIFKEVGNNSGNNSQECYPNQNGYFQYYVELKRDSVSNTFSEKDFSFIYDIDLDKYQIEKVEKSFPTAKTPILQKVISIYSKKSNLTRGLSKIEGVNNVEMLCHPKEMLLYEPNDYGYVDNYFNLKMTHLNLINAPQAYDITGGDSRILIGITDTKIETSHPDLQNKIHSILSNNCTSSLWHCTHGTAVSSCGAADTDNGIGIASIGNRSKIVFSSNWGDTNEVLQMSQIPGVRVINLSWLNGCSASSYEQLTYKEILNTNNVLVVAGAGNGPGHCGGGYCYPASYDEVIGVTSVGHNYPTNVPLQTTGRWDWEDVHDAYFDDKWITHQHHNKVNISGPGYQVPVALETGLFNGYGLQSGTSFASPIVAGVAALVAAVNPCLSAVEIKDIILSTANPNIYLLPENAPYLGMLGSGRVDAYAAVIEALKRGKVNIQNTSLSGLNTISSETSLYAGYNVTTDIPFGNVKVLNGADITFEATYEILLFKGFEVESNAIFEAKMVDSPCY